VLRFTWSSRSSGRAIVVRPIIVFADDGKSFVGHFWHGTSTNAVRWNGTRISKDVARVRTGTGTGPGEQQLKSEGRARLYGILFRHRSDHIKDESKDRVDSCGRGPQPAYWSSRSKTYDNVGGTRTIRRSEKRAGQSKPTYKPASMRSGFDQRIRRATVAATTPAWDRSENRRVES